MQTLRFCLALLVGVAGSAGAENFEVRATSSSGGIYGGITYSFEPERLPIQAGDTVTWINQDNMAHNVRADDGSFRCANGCDGEGGNGAPAFDWSYTRTFNDPGTIPYFCEAHGFAGGGGMSGVITVQAVEPTFNINFGITGTWVDPNKQGARQGFSLEVVPADPPAIPNDLLNAYWFTYAKGTPGGVGKERWFNALGEIQGDHAEMTTVRCSGGVFDDPTAADCPVVGTTTATFTSCTEGTIAYAFDLSGDPAEETTGSFPITRGTPDVLCAQMAAEAAR